MPGAATDQPGRWRCPHSAAPKLLPGDAQGPGGSPGPAPGTKHGHHGVCSVPFTFALRSHCVHRTAHRGSSAAGLHLVRGRAGHCAGYQAATRHNWPCLPRHRLPSPCCLHSRELPGHVYDPPAQPAPGRAPVCRRQDSAPDPPGAAGRRLPLSPPNRRSTGPTLARLRLPHTKSPRQSTRVCYKEGNL